MGNRAPAGIVLQFLILVGSIQTGGDVWGESDGVRAAARHSITIEEASRVVLGNGSLGCVIESALDSVSFLEATLSGEHWLIREPVSGADPVPAIRVPLCKLRLSLASDFAPEVEASRLTRNSRYRLMDSHLGRAFPIGPILAATLTVSPTRDLMFGHLDFSLPCAATLEIFLPDDNPLFESSEPLRSVFVSKESAVLSRNLPFGESYALGVILKADESVRTTTSESGVALSVSAQTHLAFAILLTHPEEGSRIEERGMEETRALADRDWQLLLAEDREWWEAFWSRSVVDTAGSSDERAAEFERLWTGLRRGFAVHARGSFPPGDSGFWPSPVGGRVWSPLLWETFRAWVLTGNATDISWLSYPLLFSQVEDPSRLEDRFSPLLPFESGPDGIPSTDLAPLLARLGDLIGGATPELDDLIGRGFSAFPLLVDALSGLGSADVRTEEVYPFLKANALRAEAALSVENNRADRRSHLIPAIEVARRQAEGVGVDLRARKRWEELLKAHGAEAKSTTSSIDPVLGEIFRPSARFPFDSLFHLSLTPDGLVRDREGIPSLVLSGAALDRMAEALFSDREGFLEALPEIPMDGSWSLEAQNISVLSGFTLRTVTMRKGVINSFLLRSNRGGICRLKKPSGWASARVLNLEDPQTPVRLDGKEMIEFETKSGEEFLIAPMW